jgi:hypothetical protein
MSKSTVKRWVRIYRLPAPETRLPIRMDIPASSYSSLTEAGAGLGIDLAVLVTQINRLEREFGHRLLDRAAGQRAMQPTAYGQKIIAAIRAASATRPDDYIGPRRPKKTPPPASSSA